MITLSELRDRQSMPLEFKVKYSILKIQEFYNHFNGQVCVSKSGLDSVVLLDLVRSVFPSVPAVFVNTGQENSTVIEHNKTVSNCIFLKPKLSYDDVVKMHGYPVLDKLTSRYLSDLQNASPRNANTTKLRLTGIKQDGTKGNSSSSLSKCYHYLIDSKYRYSSKCCDILKKQPLKAFQKTHKLFPFIGTLSDDSQLREITYLRTGCNSFNTATPNSTPLSIWTRQDILQYVSAKSLSYPTCYGHIETQADKLILTGEQHTGCEGCLFGIRKDPQRIERIKQTSPARYRYYMDKLDYKNLIPLLLSPPSSQLGLFGGAL
jgi:3'-phosphoadenosine 5'-phosphosulfate sulfotransferase (PAPS reductase)/FAD synthetase